MTRTLLVLTLALAACSRQVHPSAAPAAAARTCEGGAVRSDADLDRYAGCAVIAGDLDVRGVTSVEPLARVRAVEGALAIHDTRRLYSLTGLERLRAVGSLSIERNEGLISIASLNALTTAERVSVTKNHRLSRVHGFLSGLGPSSEVSVIDNVGLRAEGMASAGSTAAF